MASRARSFYSASFLLLVFSNLGAAVHYVFQAIMARNLNTADFGLMNSLFSLIGLLSLPLGVYTNALARQWAELSNVSRHEEVDRIWYALVIIAGGACILAAMVAWFLAPWISWWFQTSHLIAIRFAMIGAGFGMVFGLANPLAMARQWFVLLALAGVAGALFRVGVAWMGIQWGFQLSSAVVATTLYGGILAAGVFWRIRWPGWQALPFRKLALSRGEWVAPALAGIALFCICGADLLVVRRIYDPEQAGIFAQVMILGRIIFFLIGPMTTVIFPKSATALQMEGVEGSSCEAHVVRRALLLSSGILVMAASAISIFAPLGFQILRGSSDPEVVHLLRIAVWCLIPLSLTQLVIPSMFARRQEHFLLEFTFLSLLLPIGLALFRQSLMEALLVEGGVGILLLGFVLLRLKPVTRK